MGKKTDSFEETIRYGLFDVFSSPNERDRNGEEANVVDGLFAIARAIHRLAVTLDKR